MSATIRVTAEDVELGDRGIIDITDNYVLVVAGSCKQAEVVKHADGTHVITITGATGTAERIQ